MNADCNETFQSNCQASTLVDFRFKRFIKEGTEAPTSSSSKPIRTCLETNGEDVSKFYREVLKAPTKKQLPAQKKLNNLQITNNKTADCSAAKCSKAFTLWSLATSNDIEGLKKLQLQKRDERINYCDNYGWTALMMAACAGATEAVAYLVEQGANKCVSDKSGNTAVTLAMKKGFSAIVALLNQNSTPQHNAELKQANELPSELMQQRFYCQLCQQEFHETSLKSHNTSTIHLINASGLSSCRKLPKFNISQKNRGYQIMLKQGWDTDLGLGSEKQGRLYPIKTVLRKPRTGLGIEQPKSRVTHFKAFDKNATKAMQKIAKKRSRNDIKAEKIREWKRDRRLRNALS